MFEQKYLYFAILSLNIAYSVCYVNYELFRGFDTTKHGHPTTTATHPTNATTVKTPQTTTVATISTTTYTTTNISKPTPLSKLRPIYKGKVKRPSKKCPETERPMSIGTYEIPTQRDLVLFTKRILLKFFNSYHEKTLFLLKDIKEATRATIEFEKKCSHFKAKIMYRECVRQVSKKCVAITKDLVASLEKQKMEVASLTQGKICDMNSMRTDPIELIKILAMDEATMSFALPAFLRLLGGCTSYCFILSPPDHRPRLRQLTDQDLVVRHFLTSRNYVQLINDTKTFV